MAQREKQKNNHQKREILGVLIMAFALLVFLGLISYHPSDYPNSGSPRNIQNWLGIAGSFISYYLYVFTIGYSCLIFPFLIFLFGWNLFFMRDFKPYFRLCIYLLLLGLFLSTALALPEATSPEGSKFGIKLSGLLGLFIAQHMHRFLGTVGSIIVLITFLILFMLTATSWSMRESLIGFQEQVRALFRAVRGKKIG